MSLREVATAYSPEVPERRQWRAQEKERLAREDAAERGGDWEP